jgi:hypothetical protein
MPLQNRVNPYGTLIATPERGAWTGNRGVIHNALQQITKPFALKCWITCVLKYKDHHRKVMSPNRWTELFFLDDATALAAGHRPCGFCRHADYKRFKHLWLCANGERYGLTDKVRMNLIDACIHAERMDENGVKKTFKAQLATLPDGTFIAFEGQPEAYLWFQQNLYTWSFAGYSQLAQFDNSQIVDVLTPASYVAVLRAGYVPEVHLSANLY